MDFRHRLRFFGGPGEMLGEAAAMLRFGIPARPSR
jgi:hypothetical protein